MAHPTYCILGKAGCILSAKAEKLGTLLEASLGCVSVQVEMEHPTRYAERLQATCKLMGFAHSDSPLVYAGTGHYVGGVEELARLVADVYGLVDDASVEELEEIAAENLDLADARVREAQVSKYLDERDGRLASLSERIEALGRRRAALGRLQASLGRAEGALERLRAMAAAEGDFEAEVAAGLAALAEFLQTEFGEGGEEEALFGRLLSDDLAAEVAALLGAVQWAEEADATIAGEAVAGGYELARKATTALGPIAGAARAHFAAEAARRAREQRAAAQAEAEPPAEGAEAEADAAAAEAEAAPAPPAAPPAEEPASGTAEEVEAGGSGVQEAEAAAEAAAGVPEVEAPPVFLKELITQAASAEEAVRGALGEAGGALAACAAELEACEAALGRAKAVQEEDLAEAWVLEAARERLRGPPPSPRPLGMPVAGA